MSSKADRAQGNIERSDKGRDGSTSDRRVSDITEMKEAQKTNAIYRCLGHRAEAQPAANRPKTWERKRRRENPQYQSLRVSSGGLQAWLL